MEDIKKELRELRLLYKNRRKLIPTEKPTLEEKDEIANEKELMKTL